VCISHAEGAGGEEVGRLVADRLGFVYVDEEIVARARERLEGHLPTALRPRVPPPHDGSLSLMQHRGW